MVIELERQPNVGTSPFQPLAAGLTSIAAPAGRPQ
jgi:hypothetical protein